MSILPFKLAPRSAARVWGGHAIAERFGRPASSAPGIPIGESWEVYGELPVLSGPYEGRTLDEVTRLLGPQLLGQRGGDPQEGFPLLVKWLDCRDWLSVQVHPDDPTARRLTTQPGARGKSECWFFLDVEPGAEVIHGHKHLPKKDEWADLTGRDWLELLQKQVVKPGQWMYTPAGTVHALGPGMLLYEVQQSCDLTYRLYDWDRVGLDGKPRPLHLKEGREVLTHPSQLPAAPEQVAGCLGEVVVLSPYFVIEEVTGGQAWAPDGESFEIITLLEGQAQLGAISLSAGDSALVPAASPPVQLTTDSQRPWIRVRLSSRA